MLCKNCIFTTSFYLNKFMISVNPIIYTATRLCNSIQNENLKEWSNIKCKYSDKQLKLVLNTLKKCPVKEMKKFEIPEIHINILLSLKKEKITYKSLEDFVSLDVIKPSELDSICSAIVSSKKEAPKKSNLVTPAINIKILEKIKTAVGLRIGSNYVSWSQLESTGSHCNILKWNCRSVSDLPLNASPTEVIKMGLNIAQEIPIADAYVMEKESSKPMSNINNSIYRVLLRHHQLITIILTALSTKHQTEDLSDDTFFHTKFYMMKPYASAHLFGLFFGSEIVSSNEVVQSLLQEEIVGLKNILSMSTEKDATTYYQSLSAVEKEEINKSLLVTLTFFEKSILGQS